MALIGWHTAIASCSLSEKDSFLAGHDPRRMSRSCSGIHDVLPAPATTLSPRSGEPIGSSAVRHEESSSAGQPRSRMGRPYAVASREELDMQRRYAMTPRLSLLLALFGLIAMGTASLVQADGEVLGFAVVSEVPKDKARVSAKVSVNDAVSDMKLLASEVILNNLIWKSLEICHAMKLEGYKVAEGFQVATVHVIDASMLPMSLQSFAGDCLIKKAIEVAPLVD